MGRILAKSPQSGDVFKISNFKAPVQEEDEPIEEWVRPSDWLQIPELDEEKDEAYVLLGICKNDKNVFAVGLNNYNNNSKQINIDWGDGSEIETVIPNGTKEYRHQFDYDSISSSTYTAHNNCKQVLIHIYTNSNYMNVFDLYRRLSYTDSAGVTQYYSSNSTTNILEVKGRAFYCDVKFGGNSNATTHKLAESFSWDGNINTVYVSGLFYNCLSLQHISTLKFSQLRGIQQMFYGCSSLKKLPEIIGIENVTTIQNAFSGCNNITQIPYSFGKLTNADNAFSYCCKLKKLPKLDTSQVTSFSGFCSSCYSLKEVDIDASNANGMSTAFNQCTSLKKIKLNNTSKCSSFQSAFYNCYSLEEIYGLDTHLAQNLSSLFYGCKSLKVITGNIDTSNANNMSSMFYECNSLEELPDGINSSNAKNINSFLYNCKLLKSIPELDTSSATNTSYIFYGCSLIKDYPQIDVSKSTNVSQMFSNSRLAQYIKPIKFSNSITSISNFFYEASMLYVVPPMNTKNITNMSTLVSQLYNLRKINPLDCSNVTQISINAERIMVAPILYNLGASSASSLSFGSFGQSTMLSNQEVLNMFNSFATNNGKTRTVNIGSKLRQGLNNTYVKPSGEHPVYKLATNDTEKQSGKTYYTYDVYTDTFNEFTGNEFDSKEVYCEDVTSDEIRYDFCDSSDEGAMLTLNWMTQVKGWTVS